METSKKTNSQDQMINQWFRISQRDIFQSQEEIDFAMDRLFCSVETNPLGRLLDIISGLPEMRPEKLAVARKHVQQPDEMLDVEMDAAIDRVLEELISE